MFKTVEGGSKRLQIPGRKVQLRLEVSVHPDGCVLVCSQARLFAWLERLLDLKVLRFDHVPGALGKASGSHPGSAQIHLCLGISLNIQ